MIIKERNEDRRKKDIQNQNKVFRKKIQRETEEKSNFKDFSKCIEITSLPRDYPSLQKI